MITANTWHTQSSICSTKKKQVKKGQVVKIRLELIFCAPLFAFRLFQNNKAAGLGLGLNLRPSLVHNIVSYSHILLDWDSQWGWVKAVVRVKPLSPPLTAAKGLFCRRWGINKASYWVKGAGFQWRWPGHLWNGESRCLSKGLHRLTAQVLELDYFRMLTTKSAHCALISLLFT